MTSSGVRAASRPAPTAPGVWQLAPLLRSYVVLLPALAVLLTVATALGSSWDRGQLAMFAALLGGGVASIEATRRLGEPADVLSKDLLSIWWLPVAVLLPPPYVLIAAAVLMTLTQWRVRRSAVYRRVFTAAAIGLAYAPVSLLFHGRSGPLRGVADLSPQSLAWVGVVAGCGLVAAALNTLLVALAVKGADPLTRWMQLLWDPENLLLDLTELCAGIMVATLVAPGRYLLVLVALPPMLLLQRGLLHGQLHAAARLDGKTQLLNAVTWEREAAAELSRLRRARRPAAVLLLDLDHFKAVNDGYGHLAGDDVLRAVADVLRSELREPDLVGRFGGEEFVALLSGVDEPAAGNAAERLRRRIASLAVPVEEGTLLQVTASVGVAAVTQADLDVADLLTSADAALYRAKDAGRDRVSVHLSADRRRAPDPTA